MLRRYLLILLLPVFLYSCEKPEEALVLPPPTGASHATLELGADYSRQVFFDFASGKAVMSSDPKAWHLAFETGADQRHIFMNGGEKVYIHNTRKTSFSDVTQLPPQLSPTGYSGWTFDMPCGMSDSTAIGDWYNTDGSTKGEVYILEYRTGLGTFDVEFVKFRILGLEGSTYQFEWAMLDGAGGIKQVSIKKDTTANFSYFSFTQGQAFLEPPKDKWDFVFTRYRHIYRDYQGIPQFPYEVTGVLLNPVRMKSVADSLTGFENITKEFAATRTASGYRDVIGFEWKEYINAVYKVKRINSFIVWTQHNEVYKLHFLDYYNSAGEQGYPLLEFQRLQ
jgi:hypothetical protein